MSYLKYIESVLSGQRTAGRLERLAAKRWKTFDDNPDYVFDQKAVDYAVNHFRIFKHTSGDYYGKKFHLLPWQEFLLAWIFGWKYKKTGQRVTRKAYVEVSKKNGKSELAGGLGFFGAFFDGENGAECYSAANKYDQATICWNAGKVMAKQLMEESPSLARKCKIYDSITTRGIKNLSNESFFKPIAADSKTLDGVRPHFAIIDEYHEAKDDSILRNLASGMVNRSQPLLFIITTAGFNINGPCHRYRRVVTEILEGKKEDDTTFGLIFAPDGSDDWHDEKTWEKANPSLGVTPTIEGLKTEYVKALNEGQSAEINFKTKNLNTWVRQSKTWITDKLWMENAKPVNMEDLRGRRCFGAVDLSSRRDLSGFGLLFPPEDEKDDFIFWARYYMPQDNIEQRVRKDGVPYLDWAKAGTLTLTPGDVVDYEFIESDIIEEAGKYNMQVLNYDPFFATEIMTRLYSQNVPVKEFRQTVIHYNEPIIEIEKRVMERRLNHMGCEILRWMAGNVTFRRNASGLVMYDKDKSREKIDGMVILAMCFGGYLDNVKNDPNSIYNSEREGFLTL